MPGSKQSEQIIDKSGCEVKQVYQGSVDHNEIILEPFSVFSVFSLSYIKELAKFRKFALKDMKTSLRILNSEPC